MRGHGHPRLRKSPALFQGPFRGCGARIGARASSERDARQRTGRLPVRRGSSKAHRPAGEESRQKEIFRIKTRGISLMASMTQRQMAGAYCTGFAF